MLEIVRTYEGPEFLTYYPQYEPVYYEVKEDFQNLKNQMKTTLAMVQQKTHSIVFIIEEN